MFQVICLVAVLAVATAHVHDLGRLETFSFEDWVESYNGKFSQGSAEWIEKKAIFDTEITRVRAHNAKGLGWKETINHFSAMNAKEKKSFYGRNKSVKQAAMLGATVRSASKDADLESLPKNGEFVIFFLCILRVLSLCLAHIIF